jgi:hypothetical protein
MYATCPTYIVPFHHPNHIWWWVRTMKLFMQFSAASCLGVIIHISTGNFALFRTCRSQWPRSVRLARMMGSWVWIRPKAWISVLCAFILCVGSGLATGWSPVQGVLSTV